MNQQYDQRLEDAEDNKETIILMVHRFSNHSSQKRTWITNHRSQNLAKEVAKSPRSLVGEILVQTFVLNVRTLLKIGK